MFYSHEGMFPSRTRRDALTDMHSSPHVAQIWRRYCLVSVNTFYNSRYDRLVSAAPLLTLTCRLVATLGSKSSLKKVSRKAILDVDVQKACETIVMPDAPMALRLQSNLL